MTLLIESGSIILYESDRSRVGYHFLRILMMMSVVSWWCVGLFY
jgi:hypothetical protein